MTSLLLLAGIEDVRLEEKLLGLLEEEFARRLVAEAIGLAAIDRADGAIGLDLLAERQPHHAFAVELAFDCGNDRHAEAEREHRCQSPKSCNLRHGPFLVPLLT